MWSLQSTSLCFSLPLSVARSNTDSEKDRGLLKKLLCTLGGPDRLVAGKIPYYTEYKTWDKISDPENPPFHGGVGWNEVPDSGKQVLVAVLLLAFLGLFWDHPSFLCIPDQECIKQTSHHLVCLSHSLPTTPDRKGFFPCCPESRGTGGCPISALVAWPESCGRNLSYCICHSHRSHLYLFF